MSLTVILVIAIAVVAALLTGIVLIQQAKGGGFGMAFSGIGETVFGAHAASHLIRVTVTLIVVFIVLIISMGLLVTYNKQSGVDNLADELAAKKAQAANIPTLSAAPGSETTDSAVVVDSPVAP